MSGKHGHKPFEGHMHDYEAHIRAVEEDLEYYRAKRLNRAFSIYCAAMW